MWHYIHSVFWQCMDMAKLMNKLIDEQNITNIKIYTRVFNRYTHVNLQRILDIVVIILYILHIELKLLSLIVI